MKTFMYLVALIILIAVAIGAILWYRNSYEEIQQIPNQEIIESPETEILSPSATMPEPVTDPAAAHPRNIFPY